VNYDYSRRRSFPSLMEDFNGINTENSHKKHERSKTCDIIKLKIGIKRVKR